MAEALFQTVSPVWSAVPFPGLAWFQTPMAGNRPVGGPQGLAAITSGMVTGVPSSGPLASESYALGGGVAPAAIAPGLATGPSSFPAMPMAAPFPSFTGSDIGMGITAPALVTAIAARRGQPSGPTSDQEIEDFIYDALDLLPGASEVEVRSDGGRTTLTGTVSQKRLKRDIGEIAWAIPQITDVQNNITIAPRRRSRAQNREAESPSAAVAARKPA